MAPTHIGVPPFLDTRRPSPRGCRLPPLRAVFAFFLIDQSLLFLFFISLAFLVNGRDFLSPSDGWSPFLAPCFFSYHRIYSAVFFGKSATLSPLVPPPVLRARAVLPGTVAPQCFRIFLLFNTGESRGNVPLLSFTTNSLPFFPPQIRRWWIPPFFPFVCF